MSNRNTVTPEQMNNSDIQHIDAVSPPTSAKPHVVGSLLLATKRFIESRSTIALIIKGFIVGGIIGQFSRFYSCIVPK